jgi:hypothetical protein
LTISGNGPFALMPDCKYRRSVKLFQIVPPLSAPKRPLKGKETATKSGDSLLLAIEEICDCGRSACCPTVSLHYRKSGKEQHFYRSTADC